MSATKTVLVIDDEEAVCSLIGMYLTAIFQRSGKSVIVLTAASIAKASDLLEQQSVDLALVDHEGLGGDSEEFCTRLTMPYLRISGSGKIEGVPDADIICKPFQMEVIAAKVMEKLGL